MSANSSDILQENEAAASQKSGNFLHGIMAVIIIILAGYIVLMHFRTGDAGDLGHILRRWRTGKRRAGFSDGAGSSQ